MQHESLSDWYAHRLENYSNKLRLSKRKALKRLILFTDIEKLRREFDRIVDQEFWSSNEPGLRFEERQKRLKGMYQQPKPQVIQLSLFNNHKTIKNGNDSKSHRLQSRFSDMLRRTLPLIGREQKEKQNSH